MNQEEYEIVNKMEKELDEKQEKFRKAEQEWISFYNRINGLKG